MPHPGRHRHVCGGGRADDRFPARGRAAARRLAAMNAVPVTTQLSCDLLVAGSGAGGLSAAVTAAALGLKVIVVEKEAVYGGTTAWSGGWLWIPRNPLAVAAGIRDDMESARTYLH